MDFKANLTGIYDLDKVFSNLPRTIRNRAARPALRAGAAKVRDAARDNVRQVADMFTGVLSKRGSITMYNMKMFRGSLRVAVQIRRGLVNTQKLDRNGKPVRVGMYAAVLEYGSRKLNRRPRSWIRRAIREQHNQAVSAIRSEMNKRMVEAVKDARR